MAYTLIEPCRIAGTEPIVYLADVLTPPPGLPADSAGDFTPRDWEAAWPY